MENRSRNIIGSDSHIFGKLLLTMVVSWAFSAATSGSPTYPEGSDGRGLFVKLEIPWTTLKVGEILIFRYTFANAGDNPAAVAIPLVQRGLGWPAGGQPYLEAKWRDNHTPEHPDLDIHKAAWPPNGEDGMGIQAWEELPPGQQLTWNQNRLRSELFGVNCFDGLEAVQAHWLVGPNRWISSEPVPVKMVSVPKSEWIDVFEDSWSSYGRGKDSFSGTASIIPIERRLFLFWNGVRVTEVAPGDEFEHQIDQDGTNLEITIKNTKGSSKVYYHLRHGITRDTPWPIGPVSLFSPKPEPIPPAELEVLRNTANFPIAAGGPGERPEGRNASTNPNKVPPAEQSVSWRAVFMWFVAATLLAILTVIIIRKRNHAGRE